MNGGVFYFGCWDAPGHFLFTPSGDTAYNEERLLPWPALDGALCPGRRGRFRVEPEEQIQGHAILHHKDGWTALAFWDRSQDRRGGSNSAFIAKGEHDFETMKELAAKAFPKVWARISAAFPLVLVVTRSTS